VLKNNPMALPGRNIDRYINNFTALSVIGVLKFAFLPPALCQILNQVIYIVFLIFFYLQAESGNKGKQDFGIAMSNSLFIL